MTPSRPLLVRIAALLAGCSGATEGPVEISPPAATAKPTPADLLGCMDGVTVRAAWSTAPTDPYEVEIRVGEAAATCLMQPPTHCGKDPPRVPEIECTGSLVVHGTPGRDETCSPPKAPSVDIPSIPGKLTVIVRAGGKEIVRREVAPDYTRVEPNGAGLEPICRVAVVDVAIRPT